MSRNSARAIHLHANVAVHTCLRRFAVCSGSPVRVGRTAEENYSVTLNKSRPLHDQIRKKVMIQESDSRAPNGWNGA